MQPRDQRILEHLNAYRISLRPVLARLYFEGQLNRLQQVLSRLKEQGYIDSHQPFRSRLACYHLAGRAVREFGYPESRAKMSGSEATLDRNLAILWWCCMGERLRIRIEPGDVARAMGCGPLSGAHCVQPAEGVPRFFHVTVPGAVREKDILYTLKQTITDAARDAVVNEWIIHSRYVFLILVDRRTRVTILNESAEDARLTCPPKPGPV